MPSNFIILIWWWVWMVWMVWQKRRQSLTDSVEIFSCIYLVELTLHIRDKDQLYLLNGAVQNEINVFEVSTLGGQLGSMVQEQS